MVVVEAQLPMVANHYFDLVYCYGDGLSNRWLVNNHYYFHSLVLALEMLLVVYSDLDNCNRYHRHFHCHGHGHSVELDKSHWMEQCLALRDIYSVFGLVVVMDNMVRRRDEFSVRNHLTFHPQ